MTIHCSLVGAIPDTALLLTAIVWFLCSVVPISSNRRVKRITNGEELPSHHIYGTYFFAQVSRSWACTSDPTDHNLTPCQEDSNRCGASLIHPEFVITAAQCLMYYEVNLRFKGLNPDEWKEFDKPPETWWENIKDFAKRQWTVLTYLVLPKPKHTVYSDYAIYVGSTKASTMTQKRHVVSVYPHSKFPILDITDPWVLNEFKRTRNSYHDVALLRACLPFELQHNSVEVASMLKTSALLKDQYDRIVKRGTVCLYVGFGPVSVAVVHPRFGKWYKPWGNGYLLQHTWRASLCSSQCNAFRLAPGTKEHTCMLCSKEHANSFAAPSFADIGGPVMCESRFVSVVTKSFVNEEENSTMAGSYPLHCVWDSVKEERWGEAYTWTNVNCCVHNIIVGKLWIEQYGTMEIVNAANGHKAILTFKPAGWFSKDLHRVEGFIMDKNKKKLHFLYGKWTDFIRITDFSSYESYFKENSHKFRSANDSKGPSSNSESPSQTPKKVLAKLNSLKVGFKSQTSISEPDEGGPVEPGGSDIPKCDSTYSIDIPNSTTLWEATPRPSSAAEYYQFTMFAMSLNEMLPGMEKKICPTDCRLRPDIRKLENGDLDGAAAEKTRLEEQQRDTRKARKGKKGNDWKPRWFCQGTNPYTSSEDWLYTGGYWDRNYGPDPQIF